MSEDRKDRIGATVLTFGGERFHRLQPGFEQDSEVGRVEITTALEVHRPADEILVQLQIGREIDGLFHGATPVFELRPI